MVRVLCCDVGASDSTHRHVGKYMGLLTEVLVCKTRYVDFNSEPRNLVQGSVLLLQELRWKSCLNYTALGILDLISFQEKQIMSIMKG